MTSSGCLPSHQQNKLPTQPFSTPRGHFLVVYSLLLTQRNSLQKLHQCIAVEQQCETQHNPKKADNPDKNLRAEQRRATAELLTASNSDAREKVMCGRSLFYLEA